jgi:hypothetical protein
MNSTSQPATDPSADPEDVRDDLAHLERQASQLLAEGKPNEAAQLLAWRDLHALRLRRS